MKKAINRILMLISLGILALIVYNICVDYKKFLNISIGQVMTVAVAVYFAFYLTQRNNDVRVQKEVYRKILEAVQEIVADKDNYVINENTDIKMLTMTKRSLNNYMGMLNRYSEKMGVQERIDKIASYVDEYANFLGNHLDDKEYLSKSEAELRRPLEIINIETIEIMMELYK